MSALAGICNLDEEPVDLEYGRSLMKALSKYPADDVQTWSKNNVFFGCHAQWITPESVGEQLPYYDCEKKLAITADAIIDNREELCERLRVGHMLRRNISDSELILLAYYVWGEESPKYLIGDFAFMIWDERKRRLFGARDFSGNRTLYFFLANQRFAFCTAILPLFSLPFTNKNLNEQWLAEFLAIPGMLDSVDMVSTAYKHIEQIPPSHSISVSGGRVTFSRYCTITSGEPLHLKSNQEYEEGFRDVFQTAVAARLRTCYKVGAQLSGGLDSGSVVSFAANALRHGNQQLHTFSYIPPENFVDWTSKSRVADERPFIKATVQFVGNIKDHYLDFKGRNPFAEVDDMLATLETPYKFFGNSFWIKGIYEKANQQQIRVLLSGGRGNYTISWGSALDYYAILLRRIKWFALYRELKLYAHNLGIKKTIALANVSRKAFPFLERVFSPAKSYRYPTLINPEFAKRTLVLERLQEQGFDLTGTSVPNLYEERNRRFQKLYYWAMPGTSGTKMSLRYSLWERDPTNDLRVIRFCLSVPEAQYVQNGMDRALVRRATEGYLPDKVRLNQRIRGIQGVDVIHRMVPSWKLFIEEVKQLCTDREISGFFNVEVIRDALGRINHEPKPGYVFSPDFKILTRSLIVYRFLKKLI